MTLTSLAAKHTLEPESAKAFLREWLDSQLIHGYVDSDGDIWYSKKLSGRKALPLIARPTDLGE